MAELEQLIDAIVSPYKPQQDQYAHGHYPEDYDLKDQERVQKAVWALSQDDRNDLWGRLVEHFEDKRFAAGNRQGPKRSRGHPVRTLEPFVSTLHTIRSHALISFILSRLRRVALGEATIDGQETILLFRPTPSTPSTTGFQAISAIGAEHARTSRYTKYRLKCATGPPQSLMPNRVQRSPSEIILPPSRARLSG